MPKDFGLFFTLLLVSLSVQASRDVSIDGIGNIHIDLPPLPARPTIPLVEGGFSAGHPMIQPLDCNKGKDRSEESASTEKWRQELLQIISKTAPLNSENEQKIATAVANYSLLMAHVDPGVDSTVLYNTILTDIKKKGVVAGFIVPALVSTDIFASFGANDLAEKTLMSLRPLNQELVGTVMAKLKRPMPVDTDPAHLFKNLEDLSPSIVQFQAKASLGNFRGMQIERFNPFTEGPVFGIKQNDAPVLFSTAYNKATYGLMSVTSETVSGALKGASVGAGTGVALLKGLVAGGVVVPPQAALPIIGASTAIGAIAGAKSSYDDYNQRPEVLRQKRFEEETKTQRMQADLDAKNRERRYEEERQAELAKQRPAYDAMEKRHREESRARFDAEVDDRKREQEKQNRENRQSYERDKLLLDQQQQRDRSEAIRSREEFRQAQQDLHNEQMLKQRQDNERENRAAEEKAKSEKDLIERQTQEDRKREDEESRREEEQEKAREKAQKELDDKKHAMGVSCPPPPEVTEGRERDGGKLLDPAQELEKKLEQLIHKVEGKEDDGTSGISLSALRKRLGRKPWIIWVDGREPGNRADCLDGKDLYRLFNPPGSIGPSSPDVAPILIPATLLYDSRGKSRHLIK